MKITQKLPLAFLSIAMFVLAIGYFSTNRSQEMLEKTIGENALQSAIASLDRLDMLINSKAESIQDFFQDLSLKEIISSSNREFEEMDDAKSYISDQDRMWTSTERNTITPFMQGLIDSPLSQSLRQLMSSLKEREGYEVIGEIFVTNKYGANIALSNKTSDYYQADEYWWKEARKDGLHVEGVEFDESAGIYSIAISSMVESKSGEFLGIVKAVLSLQEISNELDEIESEIVYQDASVKLFTEKGELIYSARKLQGLDDSSDEFNLYYGSRADPGKHETYSVENRNAAEGEKLYAHAHSKGYRHFKGLGWVFVAEYPTKEIFAPVSQLRRNLLIGSFILAAFAVLLGLFVSRSVSAPINKLKDVTSEISRGSLDTKIDIESKDEIGELAASFNRMAKDLGETTVSKDYFDNIITSMLDALIVIDPDAKIRSVNKSACDLLGYKEDELAGNDVSLLFSEEEEEEEEEEERTFKGTKLQKLIKEGSIANYEVSFKTKDGNKIPVLLSGAVIKRIDCPGEGPIEDCPEYKKKGKHCEKIQGIVVVAKDITEHKKSEEKLRNSEKKLRSFVDASADAVMTMSINTLTFLSGNPAAIKMFKCKDEAELVSKTPVELSPEYQEDGMLSDEKAKQLMETCVKDGSNSFEWKYVNQDGEEFFGAVSLTMIESEEDKIVQAITRDITERKKAEEEFKQSEKRFLDIMHSSDDAILLIDADTFVEANEATARMLKYTNREEFLMTHPSELSPPIQIDGQSSFDKANEMMKIAAENGFHRFEWLHKKKDGEIFPVEVSLTPITYKGKPMLHCLWRDISESKKAEELLAMFKTFAETSSQGMGWADINGSIMYVNSALAELFGEKDANVPIGKNVAATYYPEEEQIRLKEGIFPTVVLDGKWSGELMLRKANGELIPTHNNLFLIRNETSEPIFFANIVTDITQRKKDEKEIAILAKFPEENPHPVLRTKKDGTIIYANKGSNVLLDFCGCKLSDHMNDDWRKNIEEAFNEGKNRLFYVNACDRVLEFMIAPIVDMDYVNIYGRDITEQRKSAEDKEKLQEQLFQSQKMEAIGTIASGIAHNFNNILGAMRGSTEMAMDDVPPDSRTHSDLERVVNGIESAKQLTAQMLAYSRTHEQEVQSIEIAPVISESINMFQASVKGSIEIRENIDANCGFISIDPNQLQHILLNLFTNSHHALDSSGGAIDVDVSKVTIDTNSVEKDESLNEGEYIKISIKDTGHGMDKETIDHIFDPFFTTKEVGQGTGLGLSMVHGIITGYGGKITVESEPGKGAAFSILLPCVQATA